VTLPLATSLYDWLMFLHVLAAMVWVGGVVVLTALSGLILRSGEHAAIARFSASLRRIGPLTLAPGHDRRARPRHRARPRQQPSVALQPGLGAGSRVGRRRGPMSRGAAVGRYD
jgi:hypothetical protein